MLQINYIHASSIHQPFCHVQVIGFLLGLLLNDFKVTFYFWLVGTILAIILCVPSWPMYRRNPIEWVEAPKEEMEEIDYEDMNLLQKIAYHVKAILARFNGESNTARVAESVPPNRDANSKKRR